MLLVFEINIQEAKEIMGYTKTEFGKLEDGTAVYRYTLTNEQGASASFTDLGGIWLTMVVPDRDGKMADVVLGYDSVKGILTGPGHPGEPVGRNANRIGGAKFTLNGVTYELNKNSGGKHNLHSGPDYYRNRVWEASVEEDGMGTKISFSLFSPDGDQGYPGNADITVSYTLTPDNSLQLDYHMVSDRDTVANFTNHAYFNLAGHDSGNAMNQKVWIDADAFTVTDADSIPTGELAPVKGTPMDFTEMKEIGRDIDADFQQLTMAGGFDHNWVLDTAGDASVEAASLYCPSTGILLHVYTNEPGIQVYTGNFLDGTVTGKNNIKYNQRTAICLETQHFPDTPNKPEWPSAVLRPGETYHSLCTFKFSTK